MNKLFLVKEYSSKDSMFLEFSSSSENDSVERSAVIELNNDYSLKTVRLYSNNYGIIDWINGEGIINCHQWENSSDAAEDFLCQQNPFFFAGNRNNSFLGAQRIIPDIASFAENQELMELLMSLSEKSVINKTFDIQKLKASK